MAAQLSEMSRSKNEFAATMMIELDAGSHCEDGKVISLDDRLDALERLSEKGLIDFDDDQDLMGLTETGFDIWKQIKDLMPQTSALTQWPLS